MAKPTRPKVTAEDAWNRSKKAIIAKRNADIKAIPYAKGSPERIRAVDSISMKYSGSSPREINETLRRLDRKK